MHLCPKLHAKNTLQSVGHHSYGSSVKLHIKREPVLRNLFGDSETMQFSADVTRLRYRLPVSAFEVFNLLYETWVFSSLLVWTLIARIYL